MLGRRDNCRDEMLNAETDSPQLVPGNRLQRALRQASHIAAAAGDPVAAFLIPAG